MLDGAIGKLPLVTVPSILPRVTTFQGWAPRIHTNPRKDGMFVFQSLRMWQAPVCRRDNILERKDGIRNASLIKFDRSDEARGVLVTLSRRQSKREIGGPSPAVPVGVHKLTMILPLSHRVSYTVEGLCRRANGIVVTFWGTAVTTVDSLCYRVTGYHYWCTKRVSWISARFNLRWFREPSLACDVFLV